LLFIKKKYNLFFSLFYYRIIYYYYLGEKDVMKNEMDKENRLSTLLEQNVPTKK